MTRLLPFTQPGEKAIQFDDGDDGGDGGEEGGDGGEGGCAAQHTFQPGPDWDHGMVTHVMVPSDGTTPAGPEVPQYFTPLTVR
mmetsp:Transcript_15446/g.50540  ORF Transcript_15446/g.50540 Transcript_15446/m.50540 type:complete len:83 (-) Transcript_15446:306-554(-)